MYSAGVMKLQEQIDQLVCDKQTLIHQRDNKLKEVTHLAGTVADLKLQLESFVQQDNYKTQLYGRGLH